jgi:hypothetical protein
MTVWQRGQRLSWMMFFVTEKPYRSINTSLHPWQKVFSPSSPGTLPV